jgi:hypothetical protein
VDVEKHKLHKDNFTVSKRKHKKPIKQGFIRALWGVHDKSNRVLANRYKMDLEMQRIANSKYNQPFRTYVMGEDNVQSLIEMGFKDYVMISDKPYMFELVKYRYRNKMEAIRYAMEEDDYDEIVYLDWDCVPIRPLSTDFWDGLGKKDIIQANLMRYRRPKALWRILPTKCKKIDVKRIRGTILNGGFLYIRDKTIPSQAIKWWEEIDKQYGLGDNDELAWQRLIDEMTNGWTGEDAFWNRFEAMYCKLRSRSPYSSSKNKTKDVCFVHYI